MSAASHERSIQFLKSCLRFGPYPLVDGTIPAFSSIQTCVGFDPLPVSTSPMPWDHVYGTILNLETAPDQIRSLEQEIAELTTLLERVVQPDTDARTNALIEIAVLLEQQRKDDE